MPDDHTFLSIPSKILLPIDFSPSSKAALAMAADLALHFHAELYLVKVIAMFPATTFPDFVPEAQFTQEARSHAERLLAKCHRILAERELRQH